MARFEERRRQLPFLLIGLFAASCVVGAPDVSLSSLQDLGDDSLENHYRIVRDEEYGPHERQKMDLYLADEVERLGSKDFTVVFLHGGAFSFNRLVVGGFSAGGQIGSTVGFSQGSPDYPFPLDEGIRIVGILNVSGPMDRLDVVHEIFASSERESWQLVARNLFPPGSPFDRGETVRTFTPFTHFSDDDPAFFLWYGGEDDQIPPTTFERFLEELARSQVQHRVLFEPQGGHSPTDAQLQNAFAEVFRFLDDIP
jgi:hypothetical protein